MPAGATGSGASATVTPTSARADGATWTVVVVPPVLSASFGSLVVALATEADPEMVEPSAPLSSTETANVKATGSAAPLSVGMVARTVPSELPTTGAVIVHPGAGEKERNLVPAGTGTVSVTSWASSGPPVETVTV